jgi:hypothetical protein
LFVDFAVDPGTEFAYQGGTSHRIALGCATHRTAVRADPNRHVLGHTSFAARLTPVEGDTERRTAGTARLTRMQQASRLA